MDWALIYGTLVRNTGWTFKRCGKQPADMVFEFLAHLAEYPTADAMMRAHYKIMPRAKVRDAVEQGKPVASEIGSFLGPARPLPAHIREQLEWAQAGLAK